MIAAIASAVRTGCARSTTSMVFGSARLDRGRIHAFSRRRAELQGSQIHLAHHAVFIEPLACSIHAVERGDIHNQDTVVIAGCGPLGLGMVAAAKMKGAASIIALDLSDDRIEVAKRCGANIGINPRSEDAVEKVRDLTDDTAATFTSKRRDAAAVEQGMNMFGS